MVRAGTSSASTAPFVRASSSDAQVLDASDLRHSARDALIRGRPDLMITTSTCCDTGRFRREGVSAVGVPVLTPMLDIATLL